MREIHRGHRYIIHAEVNFNANQSTGGDAMERGHSHGILDNADRTTERDARIEVSI